MTTSLPRHNGILLHPTSLPGPHGSGDLGPAAYHFVDWLVGAGQSVWQVLPLGSVGPGNSPYISPSAFAGNELLIDLCQLRDAGWISEADLRSLPAFSTGRVDYDAVRHFRIAHLRRAAKHFFSHQSVGQRLAFEGFCAAARAGLTTMRCSWHSTSPTAVMTGCGRIGLRRWLNASRQRSLKPGASMPKKSTSGSSASGAFSSNGRHSSTTPMLATSNSSATCRSSLPRTAPMCGRIHSYSTSTRRDIHAWWPACPRITSAPPGSAGATRCTAGRHTRLKIIAGGSSGCGKR
jgi:hypothetical protein